MPGGGNPGPHILQELQYFYSVSQSSMPVDSFPTPLILSQTQVSQPSPFHSTLPPQTQASQGTPHRLLSPLSRPWSSWGAGSRAVLCWEDGFGVTVCLLFKSVITDRNCS